MREYNEDEIRFLAREIADFFINQTKEKGVVNIDDLVDYMRKSYGVPEELTSNVILLTLKSLPVYLVNINESI
mgnify:FL=1